MYTEVYVDVLFIINFAMDTVSLYVTARLCAAKISVKRLCLGGIVGGLYSVFSLLLGLDFYFEMLVFLLACVLMCALSLYPDGFASALKYSAVMFVSSSLLGGVMTVSYGALNSFFENSIEGYSKVSYSPLVFVFLVLLSLLCALLLCSLHGSGSLPDSCEVKIKLFGSLVEARGIFDSGNMLKDSLSGRSVIIIDGEVLKGVLSKEFLKGAKSNNTALLYTLSDKEKKRFRLIGARGIGNSTYLWGVIPDTVTVVYQKRGKTHSATREAVLALSSQKELGTEVKIIVPQSII